MYYFLLKCSPVSWVNPRHPDSVALALFDKKKQRKKQTKKVSWGRVMWSKAEIGYGTKTISINVVKNMHGKITHWRRSGSQKQKYRNFWHFCHVKMFSCLSAYPSVCFPPGSSWVSKKTFTAVVAEFIEPLNHVIFYIIYLGQIWQTYSLHSLILITDIAALHNKERTVWKIII